MPRLVEFAPIYYLGWIIQPVRKYSSLVYYVYERENGTKPVDIHYPSLREARGYVKGQVS